MTSEKTYIHVPPYEICAFDTQLKMSFICSEVTETANIRVEIPKRRLTRV